MLTRLGWFTVRRRRLVLALTALFMVAAGVLGGGAFGVLKSAGFDDPASESSKAEQLLQEEFGGGDPNVVLVVSGRDGAQVDDAAVAAAGADITTRLDAIDGVEQVVSYWSLGSPEALRSTGGDKALVLARVVGDDEQLGVIVEEVKSSVGGAQGEVDVLVGGQEAVFSDVGSIIESDLVRAELIAIPLTLILLLFVFRGLVAASLPLLVGVIAVLGIYIASVGLIGYFMVRHGKHKLALTAAVAVGVPVLFFVVFERWFLVQLPKGPIEAMLGL
jgi:RND superfamily putative drug exporter